MKQYTTDNLKIIISAANKLVNFIKPTFGPSARGVIVQDGYEFKSVDDGVAIAKLFELENEFENSIVQFIKEAAVKTNERVGDGTTGSLIILQSLINKISKKDNINQTLKQLDSGLESFRQQIKLKSHQIKIKKEIEDIAYISFNDKKIANIISEIAQEIGKDGVISVEDSNSTETTYEIVKGMKFNGGLCSPYMITDSIKSRAVIENCAILVSDSKITDINLLLPVLEKLAEAGKRDLIIIADEIGGDALATLVINKLKGIFNSLAIKAPSFGERKTEILEDIAAITGAEFISKDKGIFLKDIELDMLGEAKRVISGKDETIIVNGKGKQIEIEKRIEKIKNDLAETQSNFDKDRLKERLARLSSGVAVLKIGASTESETKFLKYKAEDAVSSVQAALRGGYVRGAGITLSRIKTDTILDQALKAPFRQIKNNGTKINQITKDVIDPTDVIIAQVESAISITKILLNSAGILIEIKKNE